MGVVRGAISIRVNISAVLHSVRQEQDALRQEWDALRQEWDALRQEQDAFRQEVERAREELQNSGDERRADRPDAEGGSRAARKLRQRLEPLRQRVAAVVAVKDSATEKLKAVGSKVKAVGKIVAAPVVKLKDGISAVLGKIGQGLKALGKQTAVSLIPAAVGQGAKLEQSMGGLEAQLGGGAALVKANADRAFATAGLSANDYLEQAAGISAALAGSLAGDMAGTAAAVDMALTDMADNASRFGTDLETLQSAYQGFAQQDYTMLDSLGLGYGGAREEMERLLADAGQLTGMEYDMGNLAHMYSAIHAIQESLGAAGAAARNAGGAFDGSFSAMKAAAQNLLGNMAVGGDVAGSMKGLVSAASTFLLDNAIPMAGRVVASLPEAIGAGLQSALPRLKDLGAVIAGSLGEGLASFLPAGMGGAAEELTAAVEGFFGAMEPLLAGLGGSVGGALQQAAAGVVPAVASILQAVQAVLPAVLPVLQTVVAAVGQILGAAAPVIAGLVQAIGTVVSALAPVFQTIFEGIGQKVSAVLEFIGGKMGWVQEIIGTAMPVIADILTSAWSVISPVIDMAVSVFQILFNVVQRVFNGIAGVIGSVWEKVKPIVEGIGSGLSKAADKVSGLLGLGGGGAGEVGSNGDGTNNWRGGLTWVGEQGPELVELPRGSRVLPHKESVQLSGLGGGPPAVEVFQSYVEKPVVYGALGDSDPARERTGRQLDAICGLLRDRETGDHVPPPYQPPQGQGGGSSPAQWAGQAPGGGRQPQPSVQITIPKLAEEIIVREEADIDRIGAALCEKLALAARNMRPAAAGL